MRDPRFKGNPDKCFFINLPNLNGGMVPLDYPGKSKQAIVLFSLFLADPETSNSPFEYYIKTACWARKSWLAYSDAIELDIPIKFYVEDIMRDRALAIFEENGIDESEIIFANIDDMNPPAGKHPKLAKIMASIKDERIQEYEWVLINDADVFMCKGLKEGPPRFPFFRKLTKYKQEATFPLVSLRNLSVNHLKKGRLDSYFSRSITDHYSIEQKRELWLEDLARLTSSDFIKRFELGIDFQFPHASLRMVPLRHFVKNRTDELNWIYEATRLIRNEEAAFGIYTAFFNRPLNAFSKDFDIQYELVNQRHQYRTQNIYFSHPTRQENEYYWRKSIGSL